MKPSSFPALSTHDRLSWLDDAGVAARELGAAGVPCAAIVLVGVRVAVLVGGTGVLVGAAGVLVGGTEVWLGVGVPVFVGGTWVLVGATGVFVAGTGVLVGCTEQKAELL